MGTKALEGLKINSCDWPVAVKLSPAESDTVLVGV